MARIHFKTLGCRLNQAEAERLAQGFVRAGHEIVGDAREADILVVNTCSVTGSAGTKSRRAAKALHPDQRVVVTGCHAQVMPDDFPDSTLLVPNPRKSELVAATLERFGLADSAPRGEDRDILPTYPLALGHTRAFVKIQDGCNLRCTFCVTTLARGASRGRPADEVVTEVRRLCEQGCREVVLTGVHAGSYLDGRMLDLGALLRRILTETDIGRVRLSSLEPWNFKTHWVELWKEFGDRLCRHVHMSLQSGSDPVLRRMARVYDSAAYAEKIRFLREAIPGLAVTTDIIVGFPGETDEEHAESLAFVEKMAFAGAHIFTFSPRHGTPAAAMPGQVAPERKLRRYREMKSVTDASAASFRAAAVGRQHLVLWEDRDEEGSISGLTDNYLRVRTDARRAASNTLTPTLVRGHEKGVLLGMPVD